MRRAGRAQALGRGLTDSFDTLYHTSIGLSKGYVRMIASSSLCKFGQGLSFPGAVQVRDDAVDDALAAFLVGEAGHRAGASSHFAEGALDDVGGAHFLPVRRRRIEKVQ